MSPPSSSYKYRIYNVHEGGGPNRMAAGGRLNRSFDVSDFTRWSELEEMGLTNGGPGEYGQSQRTGRTMDRGHHTRSSRSTERTLDAPRTTTSRSGRILDRSPDARKFDRSFEVRHSERSYDRHEFNPTFDRGYDFANGLEPRSAGPIQYGYRPTVSVQRSASNADRSNIPQSRSFGPGLYREARLDVPSMSRSVSNDAVTKSHQTSLKSVGQSHSTMSTSTMRDMLNKSLDQSQIEGGLSLDLVYITERIISMTFPTEGHDTTYAFQLKEAVNMLRTKHADNYLILNLSEKRQDLTKANPQVKEYGWPDHLAPPLERLCSLCKSVDSWLNSDIRNVVVLHCKGGRSRLASIIAAYLHYSNICARYSHLSLVSCGVEHVSFKT
uniref:Phosphatase tensin-type domain-containing protein n=1 Tax=Biomphalaria glabrata TaxID=6526 RepID=A0A2C9JX60_BIOGL